MKEVLNILKKMPKYKIRMPNGCGVEFFLSFVYLMGKDILDVVVDSRRRRFVFGNIIVAFLSIIPKMMKPKSLMILG